MALGVLEGGTAGRSVLVGCLWALLTTPPPPQSPRLRACTQTRRSRSACELALPLPSRGSARTCRHRQRRRRTRNAECGYALAARQWLARRVTNGRQVTQPHRPAGGRGREVRGGGGGGGGGAAPAGGGARAARRRWRISAHAAWLAAREGCGGGGAEKGARRVAAADAFFEASGPSSLSSPQGDAAPHDGGAVRQAARARVEGSSRRGGRQWQWGRRGAGEGCWIEGGLAWQGAGGCQACRGRGHGGGGMDCCVRDR